MKMIGYITLGLVAIGTLITLYKMYKDRESLAFIIRDSYKNKIMMIDVTIVNRLGRPIEIGPLEIECADGSFLVLPDVPLKIKEALQNGIGHTFSIEITQFHNADVKSFVIRDKENRLYKGKVPKVIRKMIHNWH